MATWRRWVMPVEWPLRRLTDVVSLPEGQVSPLDHPYRSQILLAPDHIESGTGEILRLETAESQGAISGKYVVHPGDVVFSKIRPALRKVVLADFMGICSADMYPLRPGEEMSGGFVKAILLGDRFSRYVESLSGRTGIPKVNRGDLEGFWFPVPPLGEQRRIVEVIDSFTELERRIEASIAKTRLIHREISRRVLLGENRHFRKIEDVATVSSGSTPSRARRDFWEGGDVLWVRTGEIDFNVITETGEHVTRKAVREAGLRVYPQGTVLLAMYGDGATRGRVGLLGVEATINQAAAAIVCDPIQVDHRYLYYFLETQYAEIRNIGQGSNRSNLNGALVGAMEIPLPSVEEQRELVISLEAFDSKVQADRAELAKLRELKQGLVDDLLSGRVAVPAVAA
ncbi:restriction endonuclease subunit S [Streptomyces bottropensis]|uniref:restriction endonuclease subunit S n=1 Tax=Streptomyces bottropensis TaxID=42235 RepID=UPI0036A5AF2A